MSSTHGSPPPPFVPDPAHSEHDPLARSPSGADSDEPDPLATLADEFLDRYRRGEHPGVTEFTERFPDRASEIREMLSALILVERLRPHSHPAADATGPLVAGGLGTALERLGDYRILCEVGRGGMGVVYEAEQVSLNRRVALKVLSLSQARSHVQVQRFLREARAAAQLHHTNIVPIYAVGEVDGVFYYAMQFIRGQGLDKILREVVRRKRPVGHHASSHTTVDLTRTTETGIDTVAAPRDRIPDDPAPIPALAASLTATGSDAQYAQTVARLGIQAAEALEYAHSRGTLHRDVKPSNLMLDERGNLWITDFGLAKSREDDDLTRTGDLVGTLRYIAPERFRGSCDHRADIYALGLTLYELLALRPTFGAVGRERLVYEIQHTEPQHLGSLSPGLPRDLATIVHKAIEKDPADRYASARSMADDLRCFLEHRPIRARPIGSTERLTRWARRNPGLATLGTLAAGMLALTVAVISAAEVWLIAEHATALKNLERATEAEARLAGKLVESSLAQARAGRRSGVAGRRFASLQALQQAVALTADDRHTVELRSEAIACLGLVDLRPAVSWPERPEQGYLAFDFDPAFERVARGQASGDVILQETRPGGSAVRLPGNGGRPVLARFSPDGRILAVRSVRNDREELAFWDVELARPIRRIADGVFSSALDFHPSGSEAAVGLRDGSIVVYQLPECVEARRLTPTIQAHQLRFDHEGRRLAIVSPESDTTLQVRDYSDGSVEASWDQPRQARTVDWDPQGRWIAAAGQDGRIHVVNPGDPSALPRIMEGHSAPCVALAVHPAGELLASASWDGSVRVWHLPTATEQVRAAVGLARGLRFSRNGRFLGPGDDESASWVWELADGGEVTARDGLPGAPTNNSAVGFLEPTNLMITAGESGVRLTSLDAKGSPVVLSMPGTRDAAATPRGDQLYISSKRGLLRWPVTRLDQAQLAIGPPVAIPGLSGQPTDRIAISRDGKTLAVVMDREAGRVALIQTGTDQRVAEIRGHRYVDRIHLSPDGRLLATGTWRGQGVKIWDGRTGELLESLPVQGNCSVVFAPDGRSLITGSGQEYQVWTTADWTPIHRFERGLSGGLPGLSAFAPSGSLMARVKGRGTVELVDMTSFQPVASIDSPRLQLISGVGFSPDGRLVVLAPNTPQVWAWNLGAIRRELVQLNLDWHDPKPAVEVSDHPPERVARTIGSIREPDWLSPFETAESLARQGDPVSAIASYRNAIRLGDPNIEAWTRLALCHLLAGDLAGYREACARLLVLAADQEPSAATANNLAWACAIGPGAVEDYTSVVELSRRSVASWPETNRLNTLGAILFRAGRVAEALEMVERSVEAHGAGGTAYDAVFLALIHEALGNRSEAQHWLDRARSPAPLTMNKPDESSPTSWIPTLEVELLLREAAARVAPERPAD